MSSGSGRTPFIAGNWKMNKTVAEAESFVQALLPRVASVTSQRPPRQHVDVLTCTRSMRSPKSAIMS